MAVRLRPGAASEGDGAMTRRPRALTPAEAEAKAQRQERRRLAAKGRSERSRRAAGAIPRATYEANALTQLKPWAAFGVSRATWYRHGRPMPFSRLIEMGDAS